MVLVIAIANHFTPPQRPLSIANFDDIKICREDALNLPDRENSSAIPMGLNFKLIHYSEIPPATYGSKPESNPRGL